MQSDDLDLMDSQAVAAFDDDPDFMKPEVVPDYTIDEIMYTDVYTPCNKSGNHSCALMIYLEALMYGFNKTFLALFLFTKHDTQSQSKSYKSVPVSYSKSNMVCHIYCISIQLCKVALI